MLAQQGSASRAEKGVSVCRKRPEPVEVPSLRGKVLMCEKPKRSPEIVYFNENIR